MFVVMGVFFWVLKQAVSVSAFYLFLCSCIDIKVGSVNLRGGKKPVSRATARFVAKDPQKPRIVKSPNREDFNADNNIPEEDGDYRQVVKSAKFRRSRTIQGKRSKTSKHSKALIPWATTIFPSKRKFSFLKEGLNKIAKTSSVACKDIYRRAKVMFMMLEFERLLLLFNCRF